MDASCEGRQRRALLSSFAGWHAVSVTAIGPAQRQLALRCAGECLWALGVSEYDGIKACEPPGPQIELSVRPDARPAARLDVRQMHSR